MPREGWSVDNMKRTGLNGYVDDIVDIHKYLMKKKLHSVIKCLSLLKKRFLQD